LENEREGGGKNGRRKNKIKRVMVAGRRSLEEFSGEGNGVRKIASTVVLCG
jgi:hypothetical protein